MSAAALVIGVGNSERGDDGVGPLVARRVKERGGDVQVEIVDGRDGDVTDLLERWVGADVAVLVDAMVSADPPGTVRRYDDHCPDPSGSHLRGSTHGIGVWDIVELARVLQRRPSRVIVYGVRGASFELGAPLSQPVAQVVDRVVEGVWADVARGRVVGTDSVGHA